MVFEPSRLALARRRRGWKRAELARRSGIRVRTITAYELGERAPSEESLGELAKALGYPVEFFFRPVVQNLQQEGISFRALSKMTAAQREKAIAAGELALELLDWASERFELPVPDVPDLHLEDNPESAAVTLRSAWGISDRPISHLIGLLEAKGIRVFSLAENDRTLDGFSFWHGEQPYIFLNTLKSAERSRFDAAHELGHLVLHRHGSAMGIDVEREAMAFASAFLMPKPSIYAHVPRPPSIPTLMEAKKWWGVALSALIRRLYELNLITRWYYRALFIQLSRAGYKDREPEPITRELSHIWPLVFQGLREDGMSRSDLAKVLNWPLNELKALVFQLVLSDEEGGQRKGKPTEPPGIPRGAIRLVR